MRLVLFLFFLLLFGCDSNRVFENYQEFKDKAWNIQEPAEFEFTISDASKKYNVLYNVRNSLDYPFARLFIEYTLTDSTGAELSKKLLSNYLFDQKTGRPLGRSGLGDVYDHQFLLLQNQSFQNTGKYHIRLEQFNRLDTLTGILAIGVRVETAELE